MNIYIEIIITIKNKSTAFRIFCKSWKNLESPATDSTQVPSVVSCRFNP